MFVVILKFNNQLQFFLKLNSTVKTSKKDGTIQLKTNPCNTLSALNLISKQESSVIFQLIKDNPGQSGARSIELSVSFVIQLRLNTRNEKLLLQ